MLETWNRRSQKLKQEERRQGVTGIKDDGPHYGSNLDLVGGRFNSSGAQQIASLLSSSSPSSSYRSVAKWQILFLGVSEKLDLPTVAKIIQR